MWHADMLVFADMIVILSEDLCMWSIEEASSSLYSIKYIGRGSNREDRGNRRLNYRMRGGQNNRMDVTCCNCKESCHVKNQCLKLMTDKGRMEMNMASNFEGETLIF